MEEAYDNQDAGIEEVVRKHAQEAVEGNITPVIMCHCRVSLSACCCSCY